MAMKIMNRKRSSYRIWITCIDPADWIQVLNENNMEAEFDMEIMECKIEDSDRAIRADM